MEIEGDIVDDINLLEYLDIRHLFLYIFINSINC